MNVAESLTAKVGPLPAWAWGLGLGGLIIGVRAYRARHAPPSPAAAVTSDGETAAAGANLSGDLPGAALTPGTVGGYTIPSAYQGNPGGVIVGPDGNLTDGTAAQAVNNQDWSNQAFDVLRARGYQSLSSSEAIRKYLAGEPVTPAEEGMIGIVLTALGQPPEGAPAISKATTTTGAAPEQPTLPTPIQPAPAPAPRIVYDPSNTVEYIGSNGQRYRGTPVYNPAFRAAGPTDPSGRENGLFVGSDGRSHLGYRP